MRHKEKKEEINVGKKEINKLQKNVAKVTLRQDQILKSLKLKMYIKVVENTVALKKAV